MISLLAHFIISRPGNKDVTDDMFLHDDGAGCIDSMIQIFFYHRHGIPTLKITCYNTIIDSETARWIVRYSHVLLAKVTCWKYPREQGHWRVSRHWPRGYCIRSQVATLRSIPDGRDM